MKKIYDFVFAEEITRDTVFYQVQVGRCKRDQQAYRFIKSVLPAGRFLFAIHHENFAEWLFDLEKQLFSNCRFYHPAQLRYLRRKCVQVTWLASFLRKCPPQMLNSAFIDCSLGVPRSGYPLPCLPSTYKNLSKS